MLGWGWGIHRGLMWRLGNSQKAGSYAANYPSPPPPNIMCVSPPSPRYLRWDPRHARQVLCHWATPSVPKLFSPWLTWIWIALTALSVSQAMLCCHLLFLSLVRTWAGFPLPTVWSFRSPFTLGVAQLPVLPQVPKSDFLHLTSTHRALLGPRHCTECFSSIDLVKMSYPLVEHQDYLCLQTRNLRLKLWHDLLQSSRKVKRNCGSVSPSLRCSCSSSLSVLMYTWYLVQCLPHVQGSVNIRNL